MKRDMEHLNLRDAFAPMPEEAHDALMSAARRADECRTLREGGRTREKGNFQNSIDRGMHYRGNHGSSCSCWKHLRLE